MSGKHGKHEAAESCDHDSNGADTKIKMAAAVGLTGEVCAPVRLEHYLHNRHPNWGAKGQILLRRSGCAAYPSPDGKELVARGAKNPSARLISNRLLRQRHCRRNARGLRDITWVWGQFLDHELSLTLLGTEPALLEKTDRHDPLEAYPGRSIPWPRSRFQLVRGHREQPNDISSLIDGSMVYGGTHERQLALRRLDGTGRLKLSAPGAHPRHRSHDAALTEYVGRDGLLPYNIMGLDNQSQPGQTPQELFVAGDVRCNENVALTCMHTLWAREHNRLCDELLAKRPRLRGAEETVFQHARRHVVALLQHISFDEYLPALLGRRRVPRYRGFCPDVNPGMATEFSTAAYRFGHSAVSSKLLLWSPTPISSSSSSSSSSTLISSAASSAPPSSPMEQAAPMRRLRLRHCFFAPAVVEREGVEAILGGACHQRMKEPGLEIVDELRNHLFGDTTRAPHLLDLATLNMVRGRDHGLPDYNTVRVAYGLARHDSFAAIGARASVTRHLEDLYGSVDAVDPWVGGLAEPHLPGGSLGELITTVVVDQFARSRAGDSNWWQIHPHLSRRHRARIERTRLSDVLRRNTSLPVSAIPDHVFRPAC